MIGKGIDAKKAPNFPGQGHQLAIMRSTKVEKQKSGIEQGITSSKYDTQQLTRELNFVYRIERRKS